MWSLIAQQAQSGSDWMDSLGPFLPFGVVTVGVMLDQRATIKELRGQLATVNERLVETSASSAKALTEAAVALAENTEALSELTRRKQ